jgi:YesN/AraC family two-component response regulator
LRLNLERHGCETVIEARDGKEGLDRASANRPGQVISDALMPGVDGLQFLRLIKLEDALKIISFVFYSAVYTGLKAPLLLEAIGNLLNPVISESN